MSVESQAGVARFASASGQCKNRGRAIGVAEMTNHSLSGGRATELVGRLSERESLDLLIAAVRAACRVSLAWRGSRSGLAWTACGPGTVWWPARCRCWIAA
jgi:hypothetical protein